MTTSQQKRSGNSILNISVDSFPHCEPIWLYPVVDSSSWIKTLSKSGVNTIQLRIKNLTGKELEEEIIKSIDIANTHQINLFINDYWELAIKYGAYGVHLGQEDIHLADLGKINDAKLRLGISTHSYHELDVALTCRPSYIALGPIFPTTSKVMPWAPQGIDKLKQWQVILNGSCQLVAIGGINLDNIDCVLTAGIRNIALISGITNAANPVGMTQQLLDKIRKYD